MAPERGKGDKMVRAAFILGFAGAAMWMLWSAATAAGL
jgi:hypothetical protein